MDVPYLPTLQPQLTLLDTPRGNGALQSLVVNHLITFGGDAVWVDAGNQASTHALNRVAPSPQLLERVQVARGFTAFQHYTLVERLSEQVQEETCLVVVPLVDYYYGEDEVSDREGVEMLEQVLYRLRQLARDEEVPVLVTAVDASVAVDVGRWVSETIECIETEYGPRFRGDSFETLVYPDGTGVQTTLELWRRILQERLELVEEPVSAEVAVRG